MTKFMTKVTDTIVDLILNNKDVKNVINCSGFLCLLTSIACFLFVPLIYTKGVFLAYLYGVISLYLITFPSLFKGLSITDKRRKRKLNKLKRSRLNGLNNNNKNNKSIVNNEVANYLRECLTICNAKATTLLTFNAIALAILAIWLNNTKFYPRGEKVVLSVFHFSLDILSILFLISCLGCLYNTKILWPNGAYTNKNSLINYIVELDKRTFVHRFSLTLTVSGVIFMLITSSLHSYESYSFWFDIDKNSQCQKFSDQSLKFEGNTKDYLTIDVQSGESCQK